MILVEFDVFRSKLPDFYQFFSPDNAVWLAIVLGVTKVLHEFGHGLSCKHFGGECHEMGVMILVLTPCLYCNVSDSWMLPNKWQRAAIGAAGIYVEVVLASMCHVHLVVHRAGDAEQHLSEHDVHLLGEHDPVQRQPAVALRRLLHPGRPRGDPQPPAEGDQRSSTARWASGSWASKPPEDPFLPQRNQVFFMLYTVAAVVYRWFIMLSILCFLYKVFEPYGLQIIGQGIIVHVAVRAGGHAALQAGQVLLRAREAAQSEKAANVRHPGRVGRAGGGRLLRPAAVQRDVHLEIKARDADWVYVDVPGRLEEVNVQARPAGRPRARRWPG